MIHFSYIHVPTNQNLEKFSKTLLEELQKDIDIRNIQVTFKKRFDLKNRTREVVSIIVYTDQKNICCEIDSVKFKKSVTIAVNSLKNIMISYEDRISA